MANERMGLNATWAMAVGGMVGGGIFSVLGVVIDRSGSLAWAAFLVGGILALATGDSYVRLARHFEEGGGAFTYLRRSGMPRIAGGVSWMLIVGYVLTISVYAFTFSHYAAGEVGLGPAGTRALAVAVIAFLVAVNLRGVASSATLEVFLVWGKVAVLVVLGVVGVWRWNTPALSEGVTSHGFSGIALGAATVFMAYEGFQLLTYDYDDIEDPDRTLPRGVMLAIVCVIGLYVLVAVGAAMLVGADKLVAQRETALALAGDAVLGATGRAIVAVAAAFSAGSAINATLFSTARLAERASDEGQIPSAARHENRAGVPDRGLVALGAAAATLAAIGSLGDLVEAASLAFLLTFAIVNVVAARTLSARRWVPIGGALGMTIGAVVLSIEIAGNAPLVLAAFVVLLVASFSAPFLRDRNREHAGV
ncbi:MAG: APC family permease [Dehalococcoidia bacterium]|nr:APC family permease [Dehalococcoidia bacterium]MCB9491599.1 APC family permease [Dehalococcoidia bacterium]